MRHFIYFSAKAPTTGNIDLSNLMNAGRLDIAIHSLINALFLSHKLRENVVVHWIFYGPPNPPRHLEFCYKEGFPISKKDVGSLIKKMLYKCKDGEKNEVFPGCFIEKKNLFDVLREISDDGNEIYILDKKGKNIRAVEKIGEDVAFLFGDHEGLPKKELKRLKKEFELVSVGPNMYLASQTVTIVNNELDIRATKN